MVINSPAYAINWLPGLMAARTIAISYVNRRDRNPVADYIRIKLHTGNTTTYGVII